MQETTNVLFVIPSLTRAGAETQLVDLINDLDDACFTKTLVVLGNNIDQLEKINTDTIEFIHLPRKNKFDTSVIGKLAQVIDDKGVDIVHTTLNIAALFGYLAKRRSTSKPPVVATVHTTKNRSFKEEFWEKAVYSRILAACEKVIFVCQNQFDHWAGRYPRLRSNGVVVHNGIDVDYFSSGQVADEKNRLETQLNIPSQSKVLCCIAAFRPEKGHLALLSVFKKLPNSPHLILAGDGRLRGAIEQAVVDLGLQDRVHLLGNISDVRPVLEIADLSVLASTAVETFSIAMLESMAMGVPVVCANIGGLSEAVISGRTGELFDVGDTDQLLDRLERTLADPTLLQSMSEESVRVVREKFSKQLMTEKTAAAIIAQHAPLASRTTVS